MIEAADTKSNDETELSGLPPEEEAAGFRAKFEDVAAEIGKIIVGQRPVVENLLIALFADGHVLIEGVPGTGKTKLVATLGDVLDLKSSRIQFTPDLMPGDITGTQILQEDTSGGRHLMFREGPIFANVVLADEINRATPKTQSALLEAMQEKTVSIGDTRHRLEEPFLVLATQNPLEMEGTYPLPEAQLDRFLFKLRMDYPTREELHEILERTTTAVEPVASTVLHRSDVLSLRRTVRSVPTAYDIRDYAIRLVRGTHPDLAEAPTEVRRFVRIGASPRAAQSMILAGKVRALVEGRIHVSFADIRAQVHEALRHRLILNFEAQAEGVDVDRLVDTLVEHVHEN